MKDALLSILAAAIIMNKKDVLWTHTAIAALWLSFLMLSGCQLLSGYKQIDNAEQPKRWSGQIMPMTGEVNIACAGTYHCEITQIDGTQVISAETHQPVNSELLVSMNSVDGRAYTELNEYEQAQVQADTLPLTEASSVKIIAQSTSSLEGLIHYYIRVKPLKREVHVSFYPENNTGYVERFAMIDEFKEQGTYVLQAYQQKLPKKDNSLLDNASPRPLCIDLLKDNHLQRRFCKQISFDTQGEFVEIDIPKP